MRGREGQHEKKVLQKIVAVQSLARGLQKQRENEQELFQRAPSKLVVPSKDTPSSMFEPSTWAMAFPELFPWGDGVPFLKRDIALTAEEVFQYLLLREELRYEIGEEHTLESQPIARPKESVSNAMLQRVSILSGRGVSVLTPLFSCSE